MSAWFLSWVCFQGFLISITTGILSINQTKPFRISKQTNKQEMLWKFDIINSKTEVCCIKLHKKIPIILISCFKYSIIAKNETFYQILSLY